MNFIKYDLKHYISTSGIVIDDTGDIIEPYLSSNNMLYQYYTFDDGSTCLKRLDVILGLTYISIPENLIDLPITINHIDGDWLNNDIENLEWAEDIEVWKTADFLKGYYISSWGRILSPHNGIINGTNREGYIAITVNNNPGHSERTTYFVHRIVAELFIGPIYDQDVNHIDGVRTNPRWDNLEIVTRAQNNRHAIMTGLREIKLTEDISNMISELLIKYDGSPIKVITHMADKGYTITETMVHMCKQDMIRKGYTFKVKFTKKFNKESLEYTKSLLLKYDGDVSRVFEIIIDRYPDLTINNVKSVKALMKREGVSFINMKHNRKITEVIRMELINLLKENDWSVSKTYSKIIGNDRYKHISVYDIKYIKRSYSR